MGGEGVAEGVGRDALGGAGLLGRFLGGLLQIWIGSRSATIGIHVARSRHMNPRPVRLIATRSRAQICYG